MERAQYYVGLDLGQAGQPTALAAVERAEMTGPWDPVVMAYRKQARVALRYLERAPLGTTYAELIASVQRVVGQEQLRDRCKVVVDATGVGGPVMEMLRRARVRG